jgi:hypothetical protein
MLDGGIILWKNILTLLLLVASVGFLIFGRIHWQHKVHESIQQALAESENPMQAEGTGNQYDRRINYISHLPPDVQDKIKQAIHTAQPVRLVIAGSEATSASQEAWPNLLKKQLEAAYGPQVFSVTVKEYKGMTTKTAISSNIDQDIIALKPDILLFEPFILNNNGVFDIADTLADVTTILKRIQSSLPNITIMLQPPNPVYNAKYYPLQVEELKKFAEQNGYIYLDHWSQWPDYRSADIQNYLDNGLPNQEGHRLWADFLIDYFIAKK